MNPMLNNALKDPMFFYLVAFVIFLGIAFKYGRKPLLGWLDGEIHKISLELEQARALRVEAEATLAEYKLKQAAALAEAEGIIRFAQDEAARLKMQAATDLKNALARHEQQAAERIRLAETEALETVRRAAVDLAMQMATETLTANLKNGQGSQLIDQALAEIPSLSGKPAKAA